MRPTPNIWSFLLSIVFLTLMYWPKGAISPNKRVLWMYIWLFVWAHLNLLGTTIAFWSFLGLKDNNLSLVFSFSASKWFSFSKYFLPFSSPKMYFPPFPSVFLLLEIVVADTLVFYLDEYFIELNQAKLKILNQFSNWISQEKDYWIIFELNNPIIYIISLNWISS